MFKPALALLPCSVFSAGDRDPQVAGVFSPYVARVPACRHAAWLFLHPGSLETVARSEAGFVQRTGQDPSWAVDWASVTPVPACSVQ